MAAAAAAAAGEAAKNLPANCETPNPVGDGLFIFPSSLVYLARPYFGGSNLLTALSASGDGSQDWLFSE